jgi:hypothetical protein
MPKQKTRVAAVAVFALTVFIGLNMHASAIPKTPNPQIWTPGCVASVPRSWGTFRGSSAQSGLAFEDSAGTLRFLTNIPCDGAPVVALEIRRTVGTAPNTGDQ